MACMVVGHVFQGIIIRIIIISSSSSSSSTNIITIISSIIRWINIDSRGVPESPPCHDDAVRAGDFEKKNKRKEENKKAKDHDNMTKENKKQHRTNNKESPRRRLQATTNARGPVLVSQI